MRRVLTGAFVLAALAAVGQACGGSESAAVPTDGGGTDTGGGDDSSGGPIDASKDVDDDGPVIDPTDAGGDPPGPDGGPCNTIPNVAPAVTSHCRAGIPAFAGGALVAGRYYLVDVAAIATQNYCDTKFLPIGFRETAELTVDPTGVGTAQTVLQLATTGLRHATSTLAPGAGNTTPAAYAPVCNGDAAGKVPYSSGVGTNGKQQLAFLGRYGTGLGVYRLEKQ
jgi:hypothetical protein